VAWLLRILSLWINLSPSLPLGIYHTVPRVIERGSIVIVCLPANIGLFARSRGYLGYGSCPGHVEHLGKRVAGIPGDTVEVEGDGVRINHFLIPNSRPLATDARGRPLTRATSGVVRPNELFLLATDHWRSFDGRYFGAIAMTEVLVVERLIPN
jgi:conjugative transfer signal peptidase TraF